MRRLVDVVGLLSLAAVPLCLVPVVAAQAGEASPDGQNFVLSAPGELRIVGDEHNYDIHLPTDILFDFDKSRLRPEAEPLLRQVRQHFESHETDQVHVWGHTDSKGSEQYNYRLSMARAKAVCDWIKREVGGFNMCIGRGEDEPLVPNEKADGSDDPLGRQQNRRVTISVVRYPDVNEMLDKGREGAADALSGIGRPTPE